MRTTKLLPILAATIAAGLLVLATTTSNGALAIANNNNGGTSAASVIAQLNSQKAFCLSGTTTSLSCNQAAANTNLGNAVSVGQEGGGGNDDPPGGSTPSGSSAFSGIFQANKQAAACISGTTTDTSCNQAAANTNLGNAVSAAGIP